MLITSRLLKNSRARYAIFLQNERGNVFKSEVLRGKIIRRV